ncbi:MAG: L,D-transpeptidase family protein [Bacteroidota bacterium]|nr:L,D-transpeptidase family protein [Bacteroidota bacterium]
MAFCMLAQSVTAQIPPEALQEFLAKDAWEKSGLVEYPKQVREFYKMYHYNIVWLYNEVRRKRLLDFLKMSPNLGLKEKDYHFNFIRKFPGNKLTIKDSLIAEIRFTNAAIHFFRDVVFGNISPDIGYNGLNYFPDCFNIPSLLTSSLLSGQFSSFLQRIEMQSPEYIAIKNKIIQYNKMLKDTAIKHEIRIKSKLMNSENKPLILKLYQLGLIDSLSRSSTPGELKEKIKEAQQLFSVLDDGVLGTTTMRELNLPLSVRISWLNIALNTIRWLRCIREQEQYTIIVNIPSATLLMYGPGNLIKESKIIVGKKSTPTPTLCSNITEVILFPYWFVPKKIASRELLPLIKKNISYLNANNFQVLNEHGEIILPFSVNWKALSANYFPYTLRQSTGCDNSLGIIKLNFYSPYSVYLHDTPLKSLFDFNRRYFSHGCMRVEKAVELARFVLKDNTIAVDTITEKSCLYNQKPISVPVNEKVPLFVLYSPAWVDSSATVRFYGNIYNKKKF